jgi:hypothetical protein
MNRRVLGREAIVFGLIYVWLSWIDLRVKLYTTPAWFDGTLIRNHHLLLKFSYTNNEQSRLLQFYVPELFHEILMLSIEHAYMLQRFLFVFLAFICFHAYLRRWFDARVTFCGVLLLAAIIPFTYHAGDLQESSPLLLLMFLLGLWTIREDRKLLMAVIFLVGGINNETMLILPLVYVLYNFVGLDVRRLAILFRNTLLVSLPMVIAVGTIRYINRDRPVLGGGWHFPDNVEGLLTGNTQYWGFLFTFGILWVYALLRYESKPLFLRRAFLMIPFFIAAHVVTGIITEVRQMLPLGFIVIPMALYYIYPRAPVDSPPETHQRTEVPRI